MLHGLYWVLGIHVQKKTERYGPCPQEGDKHTGHVTVGSAQGGRKHLPEGALSELQYEDEQVWGEDWGGEHPRLWEQWLESGGSGRLAHLQSIWMKWEWDGESLERQRGAKSLKALWRRILAFINARVKLRGVKQESEEARFAF